MTFDALVRAAPADAGEARLERVVQRQQEEFEARVINVVRAGRSKRLFGQ